MVGPGIGTVSTVALTVALSLAKVAGAEEVRPSRDRMQADLAFLADDLLRGRDTGSPEYEIAARYVAAQLRGLGLEPAGDDGTFFQAVPLRKVEFDIASAAVELRRADSARALQWKQDFVMGGDVSRTQTSVTAPVVFVGHGVIAPEQSYDDYDGIDVRGKIVLLISGAPPSFPSTLRAFYSDSRVKLAEAAQRGAVGILVMSDAEMAERYPWEEMTRNVGKPTYRWLDRAGRPSNEFPALQGSAFLDHEAAADLFAGSEHTLEEMLEAVTESRLESFDLPVEVTLRRNTTHDTIAVSNVAAMLRGSDPELQDEYVVYTAHLDHEGVGAPESGDEIYNGAYDNAMGVSLMLEVARLFASAEERPRRSILFLAVAAEEQGLLGAEYFAHQPTVPVESLVANVNLDMPLFLYPLADVTAFGEEHSSLAGPVARAAAAAGFELTPDPMPEEVIFIRSDQYPFVQQGIPALFFVPGMQSSDPSVDGEAVLLDFLTQHYHKPSDDLSRPVDWDSAERFALANHCLGLEIANQTERPSWNEGDFFGEKFGR
jgi:Zn-dependent M28 family amino/carboxypeptidase